jgi:hypothetical protein
MNNDGGQNETGAEKILYFHLNPAHVFQKLRTPGFTAAGFRGAVIRCGSGEAGRAGR